MTRAKDHLDILVPQRFYVHQQPGFGDRHVYASRTRFLPNRVMPNFHSRAWPPPPMPGEAPARPSKESCRMQMADQVELRSVESLSLSAHVVARIVVAQLSGKPPKGT